jgi:hypothetical protein
MLLRLLTFKWDGLPRTREFRLKSVTYERWPNYARRQRPNYMRSRNNRRHWIDMWWAHQDSNLEPRDSRGPKVSLWRGLSLHPPRVACGWGAGRSSLL